LAAYGVANQKYTSDLATFKTLSEAYASAIAKYKSKVKKYNAAVKKYKVALKKWKKLSKPQQKKHKKPVAPKKVKKPTALPPPPAPVAPTPPTPPNVPIYTFDKLSEQQLVSCIFPSYNLKGDGCGGYSASGALQWLMSNYSGGGQVYEAEFPYVVSQVEGNVAPCPASFSNKRVAVQSYIDVGVNGAATVAEVQSALMTHGPLTVLIDARNIFLYQSGVISSTTLCPNAVASPGSAMHIVTLVGWGTEDSVPVWYLRNSWSENWGIKGYFYVLRDDTNVCGLLNFPTGVVLL